MEYLHTDTVTITGSAGPYGFVASDTVDDDSYASGVVLSSYPMKVGDGQAVQSGDGEPAQAWGITVTNEARFQPQLAEV